MVKRILLLMICTSVYLGLLAEFQNGGLSIRRTTKNFCRSPIDLALEQTINANAANKLTGITAFTNSLNARQRWSETHTPRTAIITHLLEFLNLAKSDESSSNKYRSKIFIEQLKKFISEIGRNINPFDYDINPEKLFNLTSGKAACDEVADFLINIEAMGTSQMESFVQECQVDGNRFEKPLKRNQIRNFASETLSKKGNLRKPIDELRIERNILGKVICLALKNEIDLQDVLSYPLAIIPHSFAHFDASLTMDKQKGELTAILCSKIDSVKKQQTQKPESIEIDIIDGFYFLSTLKESPMKYGQFAIFLLQKLSNTTAKEIHIIFDRHEHSSPRDMEMKKRKDLYDNTNFKINGPNQERSSSLSRCLQSESFKNELVAFFIKFWASGETDLSILGEKRIWLSFGKKCYLFCNNFSRGKLLSNVENDHIEVESKIILHINKTSASNIYIYTSNVDTTMVYLLYHMQFWKSERNIWIQTGDISKNTIKIINVRQIFNKLSSTFINALPGWFIYTGCTYEPSFFNKGRKTCIKILEKEEKFQSAFARIGTNVPNQDDIADIEQFTCKIYGANCAEVNNARFLMFKNAHSSYIDFNKKGEILILVLYFRRFLVKLNILFFLLSGLDLKNLPPCKSVLLNKIKRTHILANMIKSSSQNIINLVAVGNGWIMNTDNELEIEYFTGNTYPRCITDIADNDAAKNDEDEDEIYRSSDDEDDMFDDDYDDDDDWNPQ